MSLSQSDLSRGDRIMVWLLRGCGVISGAVVALIFLFLVRESLPVLRHAGPLRFIADQTWRPTAPQPQYNLLPLLLGTLFTTLGAVALATPLGILSALFCRFYAPRLLAASYRRLIELLAGIPSVVYGFWGLVVLVPLIVRIRPPGASLLAGILILTIMILPTIALFTDASLGAVSRDMIRAAAALGLSRGAMVRGLVLPAARSGIFTGILLGTGRALGETMAVLMVCGCVVQTPHSLFDPIRTLTAEIALDMGDAMGDASSALYVCGLVLLACVAVLTLGAEWLSRRYVLHA